MEDGEFIDLVKNHPKIFLGFSDTTVNHLMFYKLGLQTFYGQAFLPDIAELALDLLPYSKNAFLNLCEDNRQPEIIPSKFWYEERTDFSINAVGTDRIKHKEYRGYELLQGNSNFQGELLGGCLESLYEMISHKDKVDTCAKYKIFPEKDEWRGKILFLETSEEKPAPEFVKKALLKFKELGIIDEINGIIFGKPQDEVYYEQYKDAIKQAVGNDSLPILYNVNFGHALPRAILPYGALIKVDTKQQKILFD